MIDRRITLAVGLVALWGLCCSGGSEQTAPPAMKTLQSEDSTLRPVTPPRSLGDGAATAPDTAARGRESKALPFAPPIAMDPVDGSKVDITPATPTFEIKGRIYYFSSRANRDVFVADPDTYVRKR